MGPERNLDPALREILGPVASRALALWQAAMGLELKLSRALVNGRSTATVVAVLVRSADEPACKLILKHDRAPDDDVGSGEFARHRRALVRAGDFHEHLTALAYDPISVGDGTWITFQTVAGGTLDSVQVLTSVLARTPGVALPGVLLPPGSDAASYDETKLAEVCTTVVSRILTTWVGSHNVDYPSIPQFLRLHLGDRVKPGKALAELARRWPDRTVSLEGETRPLPNPFGLVFDRPGQLSRDCVAILGKGHGDMHTENVLVRGDLGHFWLIDLSRFQDQAPLTQDPVQLTLSIINRTLGQLDEKQRTVLLDVLVEPTGEGSADLPDWLNAVIQGTQRAGLSWIGVHGLADEWRQATVLSTVACALILAARPTSPLPNRAWFLRLAARATRLITLETGGPDRAHHR